MSCEATHCPGCPAKDLGTGDPVGPETHPDDQYILLGEAPGLSETIEGRPFVGASGLELQRALDALSIRRNTCHITNTIRCRPPKNDLEVLNIRITRKNKRQAKKAREDGEQYTPLQKPAEACQPRLYKELAATGITRVVCLGKTAAKAIRGGDFSIMGIRGGCEEIPAPWDPKVTLQVAYTMHPAFVLRYPAYREVFHHDLRKAFRFFSGSLDWPEPKITISTDLEVIRQTFARFRGAGEPVAYDVETDAIDPMTAQVRCIAFSNTEEALVVPIRAIDGTPIVNGAHIGPLRKELSAQLTSSELFVLGHNAGQYDRLVCEQWLGITPHLAADTLILHLLADNELPHNLGFVGSFYTDNPEAWKADHTATQAKSNRELHIYCAKDACVTARIATPLAQDVKKRSQQHLLAREHMLQWLGVAMQRNGMRVDKTELWTHSILLGQKAEEKLAICREIVTPDFNPQSHQQMQRLLFEDWNLPPHHYSEKTGEPSTDDTTLRVMLTQYGLEGEKEELIRAVRAFRKASKLLGTYINPLLRSGASRVHPSYNRLPATGRYSSSNPNMQNVPYSLRDIFIPKEGHLLIGADMNQLEMRLIAEEAEARNSLRVINEGLDPHNETMEVVYGKGIWEMPGSPSDRLSKGSGTFKATRDITKNIRYAWQYAASTKRIHEQVVSVEDDEGNLIYAHMQIEYVRQIVEGLKRADPEIPQWWRRTENKYRKQGYIGDTLWDRRRYFRNEDKINELINHPIQSGGVHIVHEAMIELFYGPQDWFATEALESPGVVLPVEWLINHGHDALYLEVPEDRAQDVAATLEKAMNRQRVITPLLVYSAESAIGSRWTEV